MIFFADNSKRLKSIEEIGFNDGGLDIPGWNIGSGRAPVAITNTAQVSSAPLGFDFDLSKIGSVPRSLASREDVLSAYEVFRTGTSRGRAQRYAQDILRKDAPYLTQFYGVADIRTAAAHYLEGAGLPRLAQIFSPEPSPGPTPTPTPVPGPTPTPTPTPEPRNPVELLLDALPRLFGQAVYNPPLQSQATGYTPVSGDLGGGSGGTAGGGIGVWLLLGGAAIAAYFIYKRYAGG